MNVLNISDLIQAAADRSPDKWGRVTVGTGILITDEESFRRANPSYALVLPYSFMPEFEAREQEWLDRGGVFCIVPLPEPRLVGRADGKRWEKVV